MITKKMVMVAAVLMIGLISVAGCKKKEKEQPVESQAMIKLMEAPEMEAEANKAAEAAAAATASVEQTTCPIMDGNKIDKNIFVEYKGKKVYFCCAACKAAFEKDPEKYIAKLPQFAK